ncbi:SCO family protein [Cupriavidus sp. CV2]|uniref:SCO family protein n=1 Tax=Cupriavidus ulmosensis TaxID=3065913 RepID=UPI00296ABD70|nr:SCO family protein [Cupriavidus sp. CV2]MDW3682847.1 SCO family protein [Cupriavidus sp. CV2]
MSISRYWRRLAAALGATALTAAAPAHAETPWGADYFPNVLLKTQDGKTVRFYDDLLKGKAVAINLVYSSCANVCPLETAKLVQVQKMFGDRMGRDIYFYSIAIDPWDTPAELKSYAKKFGVGPGWLFLSGKDEDIRLIARKLGLSRANDPETKDGHSATLMVGNVPAGQWMRHSAIDNPQFLATAITNFLGWGNAKPTTDYAQAKPLLVGRGEFLFQSRCSACHTVGHGDRLGPDLQGVTTRRDRRWLARYVTEPDKVRAEGDPTAARLFQQYKQIRMPNLGLGSDDVAALLGYLELQNKVNGAVRASVP